jgi:thiamine kinase-like enzyme
VTDPEAATPIDHLRAIPQFSDAPPDAPVTRLGGLTNLVYRVDLPGGPVVLRLPGKGTEAYIDREIEAHNAQAAEAAGVSPRMIHVDPATGVMVTEHIECVTMSAAGFAERPGAPARAARSLAQLHRSGQVFRHRFELFNEIETYRAQVASLGVQLPDGYDDTVARAGDIRAALAARRVPLAPCHCDPLAENFLDTGDRMWVVDWEYSGMNDPMWDLGDLSVEAAFGPDQDEELLAAYFDGPVPADARARMVIYKAMCDLLWTLWGLVQHGSGNEVEDFWAYSTGRLDRCRALMARPHFAGLIHEV